jgi:hypothetical protein
VAEFYDHLTVAMIIDPNGNVAIHQARSDGYSLSVVGGVSMDVLTLSTPLSISSGGTGTATGATQNYVFAGPTVGSAGAPSFRALVNADLPSVISVSNVSANGAGLNSLNFSNVTGFLPNTLSNLNASNLAFGIVNSALIYGNTLSNIQVANISGYVSANLLSNLNASNLAFGVVNSALIYGNTLSNINFSNVTGFLPNTLSNLNASNLALGVVNSALVYGNTLSNIQAANISGLVTVSGNTLGNINASNLTFGIVNSALIYGNTLSNIQAANISGLVTVSGNTLGNINASNLAFGIVNSALIYGNTLSNLNASNLAFGVHSLGTGGTNQTTYGTTGGILYYDGTRFQAASGITVSTLGTTLNVTTANITTIQTNSFIPAASGLFMNLNATYTLTNTSNWLGNIAGTITSNLYTLFAPLPGTSSWNAYGSSAFVNPPTVNGGIKFNQPGPYVITAVISADTGIKTIALSSNLGNTVDVHSNVTNVWQYCYRFPLGDVNPWPVTIPLNVTSTSQYYYIDYETNNQADNIHRTAYSNVASEAYTGSYLIIRPV